MDPSALRVGALGVSAWAVSVALPLASAHARGTDSTAIGLDVFLAVLPLGALALGVRALVRSSHAALMLLAVAVPVSLATAIGVTATMPDERGAPSTILAALSALAYVAATAHALGLRAAVRSSRSTKLASAARARPPARTLRAMVIGTTTTVAALITIVLPALGTRASFAEAWGEAADEGRVVTAIVGGAIACVATAVVIGPSLRASRPALARQGGDSVTITLAAVVAATGALAWAILTFVDRGGVQ